MEGKKSVYNSKLEEYLKFQGDSVNRFGDAMPCGPL